MGVSLSLNFFSVIWSFLNRYFCIPIESEVKSSFSSILLSCSAQETEFTFQFKLFSSNLIYIYIQIIQLWRECKMSVLPSNKYLKTWLPKVLILCLDFCIFMLTSVPLFTTVAPHNDNLMHWMCGTKQDSYRFPKWKEISVFLEADLWTF
jgi:hypothetical protein